MVIVKKKSKFINYKVYGVICLFYRSSAIKYLYGFIPIGTCSKQTIYIDDIKH